MQLQMPTESRHGDTPASEAREAEFIISAMDVSQHSHDQRRGARRRYRVQAHLELFVEVEDRQAMALYTRDVTSKSVGFICRQRLPLGYGGIIEIADPDGTVLNIECTLIRCREITSGWFEGALYFNREQPVFRCK